MRLHPISLTCLVALAGLLSSAAPSPATAQSSSVVQGEPVRLATRGMHFVPNRGQWSDAEIAFGLHSRGLDVACRESSITLHVAGGAPAASAPHEQDLEQAGAAGPAVLQPLVANRLTLTVTFPGSNPVTPQADQPLTTRFNYFVGGEGRRSASDLPSYGAVIYDNLYDGIDLLVTGSDTGVLKYEFHCAPGSDYSQIRIAYDGVDSLCIDDGGALNVSTAAGILADAAPIVWQDGEQHRDAIPAHFELLDASTYRIGITGEIDPARQLIIDPALEWMRYLGGGGSVDYGYAATVDSAGNALVTGETESTDFEGHINESHGWDVFLAKVDQAGDLVWVVFLGGRGYEDGRAVVVNEQDDVFIAGSTNSLDFDGRTNSNHAQGLASDGYVLRVDASGVLQWMTYLGGGLADSSSGVAVNADGDVFVSGWSGSDNLEGARNAPHGHGDAYMAKLNAAGALQWATYLGGSQDDSCSGITADQDGGALTTGQTASDDFEGRINNFHGEYSDVFIASVDSSGDIQWASYLGGASSEYSTGIALDSQNNILISGATISKDFEGRINERNRRGAAFLLKLQPDRTLAWMTYLGGSGIDEGKALALDSSDNAYVVGETNSPDFYGRLNHLHGDYDAYLVKVDPSGNPEWMYYLGGTDFEAANGVAIDGAGEALVAGSTESLDFEGRVNEQHGGRYDVFLTRVSTTRATLSVTSSCPSSGPISIEWRDATPDSPAVVIFARDPGSYSIPNGNPCAGTVLGLGSRQLQSVLQTSNDSNGARAIHGNTGQSACGGYLQVLDVATCTPSNIARIE